MVKLSYCRSYPLELHIELLLRDQLDQFLEFVMIALLLGHVQQQTPKIADFLVLGLIEVALQQTRIVGDVKFVQRLHQMLLT